MTKKRRRRTRGWAGLPADPPGPPRFPSETTIDESKAFLHMDNDIYREAREQFQSICEQAGLLRKTAAGPDKWKALKDKLIAENPHLHNQFFGPPDTVPPDGKALALDVVCTDVTKRMRTMQRRMTIAEAKNTLRLNPEQSRLIRDAFCEVLRADHFVSKLEAGDAHWEELKRRWIAESALLGDILAEEEAGSEQQRATKLKALEVICRDVMKRLRDEKTKRNPTAKKQNVNTGPGPGPAPPKIAATPPRSAAKAPTVPSAAGAPRPVLHDSVHQIDPSLLAVVSDPSLTIDHLQDYLEQFH